MEQKERHVALSYIGKQFLYRCNGQVYTVIMVSNVFAKNTDEQPITVTFMGNNGLIWSRTFLFFQEYYTLVDIKTLPHEMLSTEDAKHLLRDKTKAQKEANLNLVKDFLNKFKITLIKANEDNSVYTFEVNGIGIIDLYAKRNEFLMREGNKKVFKAVGFLENYITGNIAFCNSQNERTEAQ